MAKSLETEGRGEFTCTYESGVLTISGKGVLDSDAMDACGVEDVLQAAGNPSEVQVVLEKGVTEIGACAFAGCETLTSVTIPESVIKIGTSAFIKCSALTSVTISNPSCMIEEGAFDEGVTVNQ